MTRNEPGRAVAALADAVEALRALATAVGRGDEGDTMRPVLITQRNALTVLGLSRTEWLSVWHGMAVDPQHAASAIAHGKVRAAPLTAVVAYLQATRAAPGNDTDVDADLIDGATLADLGLERTPKRPAR